MQVDILEFAAPLASELLPSILLPLLHACASDTDPSTRQVTVLYHISYYNICMLLRYTMLQVQY
jgi:hypothetical protein